MESLLVYIAIIASGNLLGILWLVLRSYTTELPRIYVNGDPVSTDDIRAETNNAVRVQKIAKRGAIFIPPTELEEERDNIIKERRAQGLDTPIRMLRTESNENDHE